MLMEQFSHVYRYTEYPYNLGSWAISSTAYLNAEPEATSSDRSYSVQYHFTCYKQRLHLIHNKTMNPGKVLHPQALQIIPLWVLVDQASEAISS